MATTSGRVDERVDGAARPSTTSRGVLRLGALGRAWRTAVVVVLAVGFGAGSLVGDDHWWPLSPWRMFSTSSSPSGAVRVFVLEVTTPTEPAWREVPINLGVVGLNRAELEGRWPLVQEQPEVLATLADAHARLQPEQERWDGVRLVRRSTPLVGGSPDREATSDQPLAVWTARDGAQVLGS
ncbi:hypothetical protein [uncultured Pseudokineococcus sp.]|uniref:hypothetical protein n=1 Tax=uncultured Pseudokineococcus sp. TaxID=1642928 RepID=UPI002624300E|nr:hypothetical protein [uncultured Pseudokineococcus sp.]